MAKQPTITTVSSGWLSSVQMNANFEALRDAFDNTLSLDGSTPNTMSADLDMGGNDILNAGTVNADNVVVDGADLTTSVAAAASSASAAASSASSAASSASSAASSASAAAAVADTLPDWQGAWVTATAYAVGDLVRESGAVYICLVAHTSGTFATDLSGSKWELFVEKGAAGSGTGDMLAANNLSDVSNAATARNNLAVPHRTGASTITGAWTYDVSPTFTGGLEIDDSNNLRWGPAGGDSFVMSSINSVGVGDDKTYLIDKTGQLIIASSCSYSGINFMDEFLAKSAAVFDPNGVVSFSHNGFTKLATSSTGVTVTGALSADTAAGNWFLDEDDLASDSATKLASQQSIKAYVDSKLNGTHATMQAGSGSNIDFTGIPSGTKKITIMFDGLSLNGTNQFLVQIGDSGGFETTGYASASSGGGATISNTTGFCIVGNSAAVALYGSMELTLMDPSTNRWVSSHGVARSTTAINGGGAKALSGELTQVRITASGVNTFDFGNVNILYS